MVTFALSERGISWTRRRLVKEATDENFLIDQRQQNEIKVTEMLPRGRLAWGQKRTTFPSVAVHIRLVTKVRVRRYR